MQSTYNLLNYIQYHIGNNCEVYLEKADNHGMTVGISWPNSIMFEQFISETKLDNFFSDEIRDALILGAKCFYLEYDEKDTEK